MSNEAAEPSGAKYTLDRLIAAFFAAVSFAEGDRPQYDALYELFIERGLLIRNSGSAPEVATVGEFIAARAPLLASNALTAFAETELAERTELWGNIAQRFSTYEKAGVLNGAPFRTRGVITTQFVATPTGWKISAMAWDDERPGLVVPGGL